METCERCGHPLGAGRFCLNCGHPTGRGLTDTAERPAVRGPSAPTAPAPPSRPPAAPPAAPTAAAPTAGAPVTPPPALQTPPEPRFPLFADEVGRGPMPSGPPPADPPPSGAPEPPAGHRASGTSRPAWLPWAVGAAALVLVAGLGVVLLVTGGGDDEEPSARDTASSSPDPTPTSEAPTPAPTPTPTPTAEPEPTPPAEPEDVATRASAKVPATAPPNTDVEGNLVRFEARNMLDGVPTTCWRMPGDGTGRTITITLDAPTTLTRVGMVNGYAKSSQSGRRTLNWYQGNRRVLVAEWTFDDGTTVEQSFGESRELQMVDVDAVTTSTVTLRLVDVSSPGDGRARRDYTAISDLSLVGTPAS